MYILEIISNDALVARSRCLGKPCVEVAPVGLLRVNQAITAELFSIAWRMSLVGTEGSLGVFGSLLVSLIAFLIRSCTFGRKTSVVHKNVNSFPKRAIVILALYQSSVDIR